MARRGLPSCANVCFTASKDDSVFSQPFLDRSTEIHKEDKRPHNQEHSEYSYNQSPYREKPSPTPLPLTRVCVRHATPDADQHAEEKTESPHTHSQDVG